MLHENRQCIDAGTVNCPCQLADCGKCIVCSRLSGSKTCDCKWQGVCIYNEYLQNNRCINKQRSGNIYKIEKVTWYEEDLVVMRLSVPRGMAEKASLPGSFVFLRSPGMEPFFDTPVSVLCSDYEAGTMTFAVKISGPKTRHLLNGNGELEMRGIYRNGLLGRCKLILPGPKRVLCLSKGLGLAPLVNYARWADGRDSIDFIIDPEKITKEFAADYLSGCKTGTVEYNPLPMNLPWQQQDQYDVIVLSASDYYQQNIYIPDSKKVLSNNCSMCCGEGVCGACILTDGTGASYRMCKCEIL